ncbi:M56 family metallopeptidase [Phenylobacterium deserti]|nr:M56 family metallopeptidase [Phenylobacterium deserti]
MSEAAETLLRVNLAATGAVALVLILRPLVRRNFGARTAYGLWLLPLLAAVVMLAPPRVVTTHQAVAAGPNAAAFQRDITPAAEVVEAAPARTPVPWLPMVWGAGLVISAAWLSIGQLRFTRALKAGRAGPAVVGVVRPRIVTPSDFEARYTLRERELILAHEQRHIWAKDPLINALVAAARCLAWFNPSVHVMSHFLRMDQELACDAAVIAAHPGSRRTYAEAMLKTQLAARPLPLGCYWPAAAVRPLQMRIGLLARPQPGRRRLLAGSVLLAGLAVAFTAGAWSARPPELRIVAVAAPVQPSVTPLPAPASPATVAPAAAQPSKATADVVVMTQQEAGPTEPLASPPPAADDLVAPPPYVTKIWTVARRSSVQPGEAVRVIARMTDRDGHDLITDLTAFGSQDEFRTGFYERDGSRYSLFTAVEQRGEQLLVTASLNRRFAPQTTGFTILRSGQTGEIRMPNGETVTVTALVRPETAEEADGVFRERERDERQRIAHEQRRAADERQRLAHERRRGADERHRLAMLSRPLDPFRCGRVGAIC